MLIVIRDKPICSCFNIIEIPGYFCNFEIKIYTNDNNRNVSRYIYIKEKEKSSPKDRL